MFDGLGRITQVTRSDGAVAATAYAGPVITDVFELQLFPLDDKAVAVSLVIAMREALARQLGIDSQELGWATIRAAG